jgi:hypothetical protein
MSREIRKNLRFSCSIPALLRFLSGDPIDGWGVVYDMGLGGVKLESRRPLAMGDVVYLSFSLSARFSYDNVRGRVVRVFRRGYYTMAGVEFDSDMDKENLREGIRTLIEEEGR